MKVGLLLLVVSVYSISTLAKDGFTCASENKRVEVVVDHNASPNDEYLGELVLNKDRRIPRESCGNLNEAIAKDSKESPLHEVLLARKGLAQSVCLFIYDDAGSGSVVFIPYDLTQIQYVEFDAEANDSRGEFKEPEVLPCFEADVTVGDEKPFFDIFD